MTLAVRGEIARPSGFTARFDLELPLEGVTAVLGASGAGKSTLLRCIAGLERAPRLEVRVDGEVWQDDAVHVPAHRRPASLVFQDGRLFPHLTTAGNLRFPLARTPRPGVRLAFDEVVDLLGLAPLLDRYPATLSGGQRQRVALGRALLAPARIWLFDEPISALDPPARREIAPYLARVCRERSIPILYVTHSLDEVQHLARRVIVMEAGRVIARTSIEALGATVPIDEHTLGGAVLEGRFFAHHPHHDLSELRLGDFPVFVRGRLEPGASARLLVAARDVAIAVGTVGRLSVLNRLPCTIESIASEDAGSCLVSLRCADQTLLARITRRSLDELGLAPGQSVTALVKSVALAPAGT